MTTSKPKPDETPDALDFPEEAAAAAAEIAQTFSGEPDPAELGTVEWADDGSATRAAALMAAAAFKASANISAADLIEFARELEPYLRGDAVEPTIDTPAEVTA